MNAPASAYALCADDVRAGDPDRWTASLYWPAAARRHAHALLAFNLQLAKIRDTVSEPMIGEIRLQWWRDAIETAKSGGNPLAEALLDTISVFNLDTSRLVAAIEARSFDLYDDPMPSEDALEGYLRDTAGTIFDAIARVLAPGHLPPPCVDHAARAYALTGLLRALPWQIMKGQLFLPLDVLERFQLPAEAVLAHQNSPALGLVLTTLRARARNHLDAMHAGLDEAGPAGAACLPAFLCASYLKRMETPGLDPFKTAVDLPPLKRQWTLWRAAKRFS
jgi:phytoene synthase